jgi:uncharacterized membrane protein YedE/YeeE
MKTLDRNLLFLFVVLMLLLAALLVSEKMFADGQVFQVIAGLIASAGTVFFQAARHTFGLPDDKGQSVAPEKKDAPIQ